MVAALTEIQVEVEISLSGRTESVGHGDAKSSNSRSIVD